jgi:glycine cleavage system H protein
MDTIFSGASVVTGLLVRLLVVIAAAAVVVLLAWGVYLLFGLAQRAWLRARHLSQADRVLARGDVHYTPGHLWLRPDGEHVRLGLDDLLRRVLPTLETIWLPREGTRVRRGEALATLRLGSRLLEVPAPVDGEVVQVNSELARDPTLLRFPYTRGWLVALRPKDHRYSAYPQGGPAVQWLRTEQQRLSHRVERELGIAGADGGEQLIPWQVAVSPERRMDLAEGLLRQR